MQTWKRLGFARTGMVVAGIKGDSILLEKTQADLVE